MTKENNPQVYARVGGALYLIMIALGIFQEAFVRGRITVGDAAFALWLLNKGVRIEKWRSLSSDPAAL